MLTRLALCCRGANRSDVCLPQCVEKLKAFRAQYPRQVQSTRSFSFNVAAHTLTR